MDMIGMHLVQGNMTKANSVRKESSDAENEPFLD